MSDYAPDGSSFLMGDLTPDHFIAFQFLTPLKAWGASFVGIANNRHSAITFFGAAGAEILDVVFSPTPNSDGQLVPRFLGVYSDVPLYSARLTYQGSSNDAFGMDNIAFVSAVPELSTSVMLLAGLSLLFGANLRRRRSVRP